MRQQQLRGSEGIQQCIVRRVRWQTVAVPAALQAKVAGLYGLVAPAQQAFLQREGIDRGQQQRHPVQGARRPVEKSHVEKCVVEYQHPARGRREECGHHVFNGLGISELAVTELVDRGALADRIHGLDQVVTRTMLLEGVWDYRFDPQTNVIDVHISRLRGKIDKGFDYPLLHTVRGAGYQLRAP